MVRVTFGVTVEVRVMVRVSKSPGSDYGEDKFWVIVRVRLRLGLGSFDSNKY